MKPYEVSILDLLQNGNLLGEFTDRFGVTQPAMTQQLYELDEEAKGLLENDRILLIKTTGGGVGNYLVRQPQMSIMVFSYARKGDINPTRDYINLIKEYISTNFTIDCIMSVNIVGDVAGPYRLQSGRRYFELNLNVITDTGVSN